MMNFPLLDEVKYQLLYFGHLSSIYKNRTFYGVNSIKSLSFSILDNVRL